MKNNNIELVKFGDVKLDNIQKAITRSLVKMKLNPSNSSKRFQNDYKKPFMNMQTFMNSQDIINQMSANILMDTSL